MVGGLYHEIRLWNHKIIEVKKINDFFNSFNRNSIGFVLYSHGTKKGIYGTNIEALDGDLFLEENESATGGLELVSQLLMQRIIKNKVPYKLRDARLMQCFSMRDENVKNAWFTVANRVYGFKNVNFIGLSDRLRIYEGLSYILNYVF